MAKKTEEKTNTLTALKIVILVFAILLIFCSMGWLLALGLVICLGIVSKFFVGIFIFILAIILLNAWLLVLGFRHIYDKKINALIVVVPFIVVIVLFIAGAIISAWEISNIKYVEDGKQYRTEQIEKTVSLGDYMKTSIYVVGEEGRMSPNVVYDKNLDGKAKIVVKYYPAIDKPKIVSMDNNSYKVKSPITGSELIKNFFDNLKNNKVIDYDKLGNKIITIYVNEKDLSKLDIEDDYYLNNIKIDND